MKLIQKKINDKLRSELIENGIAKHTAQLLAARNIKSFADINYSIEMLLPPELLKDCNEASNFLSQAIIDQKKVVIVGDYDADGATGSSVAILGFQLFGLDVDFLIPSRFKQGYGLSPEIVNLAHSMHAEIIITVDNGIASFDGVNRANELGIDVVITDHHLQAETLPKASFIVNPNRKDCSFPSKSLCGAGVLFYLLIAIRKSLRNKHYYSDNLKEPNLMQLLDLVALATIADVVPLDFNNRLMLHFGLKKIRSHQCNLGIKKLFQLSNKNHMECQASDLGFIIAPKINAAGRMNDMSLGVQCLTSANEFEASYYAKQLIEFNHERKQTESVMKEDANKILKDFKPQKKTICLFSDEWHQGVVGVLASRIKEAFYRPVIIFAEDENNYLKGSARSINGFHIRDAIDIVAKKSPHIISTFGGHAMAAGLTIHKKYFNEFVKLFEEVAGQYINHDDLNEVIEFDTSLLESNINLSIVEEISFLEWGNGFPKPLFMDEFECIDQELIKDSHSKLKLKFKDSVYDSILFNFIEPIFGRMKCLYTLETNKYMNKSNVVINIKKIIND